MRFFLALLFFAALNTTAQVTFKGNTYTYKKNKGSLHLDLIFNETTEVFAIVDSVHHLPIDYDSLLVLEYVWFGRVHEQGYCKLEITLKNEKFLICKENKCDTLTVSPPLYGTKKAKHKWLYRRTRLSWDEGNNELRVQ